MRFGTSLRLTVMGAIAVQARNIIKGKDPQDMRDPKFCAQAFAQGGAAGIYGDFLFADANRFARGPVETARGPVAGLIDDSTRLTLGNLQQMLKGQETRFGKEAVNFAKRYTPGSNTWYARLALGCFGTAYRKQRTRRHTSWRRIMQDARRNYGQEFWWKAGEPVRERAPGLGAVAGD
jgi:hypothetical protein